MSVVAIDVGQSGTRVAVRERGTVRFAEAPVGAVALDSPRDAIRAAARIRSAVDRTGIVPGAADLLAIGLSGYTDDAALTRRLVEELEPRLSSRRAMVTSDVVGAYAGAFGAAPGAVTAVGTGVVSLAVGAGRAATAGGWGPELDDAGGGFWVGREGLRAALAHVDGAGGSALLASFAERRYGAPWQLKRAVQAADSPAVAIAAFAPDVARAAHAGDDIAIGIWDGAARAIARTGLAAAHRVALRDGPFEVAFVGGLLRAGEILRARLSRAVVAARPTARVTFPQARPLDGLLRLAELDPAPGPFGGLLHVHERQTAA